MSRPFKPFGLVVALVCLAILPSPARTATVPAFSLSGLVASADAVMIGTVVANHSIWHTFFGNPSDLYTLSEVALHDTLKGPSDLGPTIFVMQKGGSDGEINRTVAGTARFEPGDRVLLFTRTDGAMHYLVGMAQGAYFLTRPAGAGAHAPQRQWMRPVTPTLVAGPPGAPLASPAPDAWLESELINEIQALVARGATP